jgi:lycopene cyclase domain-containing protein
VLDHFQYLALMGACVLITLPLEFLFGARVYRRARALAWAVLPVVLIFSLWDIIGILRQHWSYNPAYVSGLRLVFGMPVEELTFFVVVPLCALLTYEAVGRVFVLLGRRSRGRGARSPEERQPHDQPGATA